MLDKALYICIVKILQFYIYWQLFIVQFTYVKIKNNLLQYFVFVNFFFLNLLWTDYSKLIILKRDN